MAPIIQNMELVIKNLRPRTDYLVKVRCVGRGVGIWFMSWMYVFVYSGGGVHTHWRW